jgi:hypothetical protein
MKTKVLFPNCFKKVGWIIFIPSVIIGILTLLNVIQFKNFKEVTVFAIFSDPHYFQKYEWFCFIKNNISDEILCIMNIIGAILVAFSKEKHEDEYIAKVRLESLVWAIYINFGILLFCTIFVYGTFFLNIMMISMFSVLIIFIIRFNFILYKLKKSLGNEK